MSSHRPKFPSHIIPHDWDFGQLIDSALEDDGDPREKLFLHIYETGLKEWLQCFLVLKGKAVPTVISAPQNAYSELKQLLADDIVGAGENGEQGIELKKPPLPFISCDMGSISPRKENNVNFPIRNMEFMDSSTGKGKEFKRGVTYSRYPKPLDIAYTVDIWTKYKDHAAWIAQKFEEQFWNYLAYQDIRLPFGEESCMLMPIRKVGSMKNLSNLERGDNEDLLWRYQFDVVVEAWQFFDVERAPTLQIIDYAICDGSEDSFPITEQREILTGLAPIPLDEQSSYQPAQSDTVEIWPDSSSSESSSSSSLSSVNSSSSSSSSPSSESSSSSSDSSDSSSSISSSSTSSESSSSSPSSCSSILGND